PAPPAGLCDRHRRRSPLEPPSGLPAVAREGAKQPVRRPGAPRTEQEASMEQRTLGRTGVKVSAYCLGAMMFGTWGNTDEDECVRMIHSALDAGINFVDTADVYSEGRSEEIVGKALKGRRDDVVLATKVHGQMGSGSNDRGNSRLWIIKEV